MNDGTGNGIYEDPEYMCDFECSYCDFESDDEAEMDKHVREIHLASEAPCSLKKKFP